MFLHRQIAASLIALLCLAGGAHAEPDFLPLHQGPRLQSLPPSERFIPLGPPARTRLAVALPPSSRFLELTVPRLMPLAAVVAPPPPPSPPLTVAAPRTESPGAHIWPVAIEGGGRVSSPYGWRDDPFTGKRAFHGGVDIAAPPGSAVVATADGVVRAIGEHPRLGRYVMLRFTDGAVATYGHLESFAVGTGDVVRRGQTLGGVGSSGRSTGPHLDYRLEVDGRRVDPLPLLTGAH